MTTLTHTSLNQPLEGLLRPPLEWYSSVIAFTLMLVFHYFSSWFWIPKNLLSSVSILFMLFASWRFWQGWQLYRYQRHLKQMPHYTISSSTLPVKNNQLFLGKGFEWTPLHTQRLRDLDLAYNQFYIRPSPLKAWARKQEIAWGDKKQPHIKLLVKVLQNQGWWNPFKPYPPIGGYPHIHGVSLTEHDIYMPLVDRGNHTIVVGLTGVGKTRLAEILIGQDIRRGDITIVLDPKGDKELLKRMITEAKLAGREADLRIIHLGFAAQSCRYNPIGFFTKQSQVATRVTNALPSSGESATFKEFAWKYVNVVARGLSVLGLKPTYKLINFYITKLDVLCVTVLKNLLKMNATLKQEYERFKEEQALLFELKEKAAAASKNKPTKPLLPLTETQLLILFAEQTIRNQDASHVQNDITLQLINDLLAACKLDKTYYDKITASVGPLLEKLTSGEIANLVSPAYEDASDNRPILDWIDVFQQKQIVYVGLDALTDSVIASTIGNAMLSDLTATAGYLYKFGLSHGYPEVLQTKTTSLPRINLHVDEFNEVIADEFIPLLNKARGAGFNVTAYTQTWSDVEARLESIAKAGQVAGNLGTLIMFRCKEGRTVDKLIEQLPKVPILRLTPASSSSDTPQGAEGIYYQSSNEDRLSYQEMPLIDQSDIINLPKGQAFALLEGGKLFKLRLPLPVDEKPNKKDLVTHSAQITETLTVMLKALPYLEVI